MCPLLAGSHSLAFTGIRLVKPRVASRFPHSGCIKNYLGWQTKYWFVLMFVLINQLSPPAWLQLQGQEVMSWRAMQSWIKTNTYRTLGASLKFQWQLNCIRKIQLSQFGIWTPLWHPVVLGHVGSPHFWFRFRSGIGTQDLIEVHTNPFNIFNVMNISKYLISCKMRMMWRMLIVWSDQVIRLLKNWSLFNIWPRRDK